MDWLAGNLWAVWFVAALVLASAELLTGDFTLLMLGAGAAAGGITALLFPALWWLQLLVAIVVAVAMLGLVRPELLRKFRAEGKGYRSQFDQLVGSHGVAVSEITDGGGEVRVGSDTWTARPYEAGLVIPAGEKIEVLELDGVTAVVHPVQRAIGSDPR